MPIEFIISKFIFIIVHKDFNIILHRHLYMANNKLRILPASMYRRGGFSVIMMANNNFQDMKVNVIKTLRSDDFATTRISSLLQIVVTFIIEQRYVTLIQIWFCLYLLHLFYHQIFTSYIMNTKTLVYCRPMLVFVKYLKLAWQPVINIVALSRIDKM